MRWSQLAVVLLALALAPGAQAARGHLRIVTDRPGLLTLTRAGCWEMQVALPAGETDLWDLPAGEGAARFAPRGGGA
jgi:hypothetical protein